MRRLWPVLLTILVLMTVVIFIHHKAHAETLSTLSCHDIPASPDYLATGDAHDAIAAINHAHQLEHLRVLSLPANFYALDPDQQQFILVNQERIVRGLRPLLLDANLSHIAWAYSKQLLDLNFFSHTSPIGGTFSDRMNGDTAIADHYSMAEENLAGNPVPGIGPIYEYMYDDTIEQCGHRHNILNPSLTLVGISWVRGGSYGSISAQEFLTSAAWNPYHGATPITTAPYISITVTGIAGHSILKCQAFTSNDPEIVRITWFLDTLQTPLHTGPFWQIDTHQLSSGVHTLFAYAVDEEQNYSVARYTWVV